MSQTTSKKILRLDELNILESRIDSSDLRNDGEDIIDEILDLLLLGIADGNNYVADSIGFKRNIKADYIADTVYQKIEGKDFTQRVREYIATGDKSSIKRVIETEYHRVLNQSAYDTAAEGGAKYKTWVTMADDKVRETHDYIEGIKKPLNEKFVTSDYDEALYPGGFTNPANNINCRCWLEYGL